MSAAIGFPMPKSIVVDEATMTDTYARFIAQPFQSGFGHTLGNSLRRVLLSSLNGAAISSVRIDGVARPVPLFMEFSWQEYWSGLPCPSPGDHPNP